MALVLNDRVKETTTTTGTGTLNLAGAVTGFETFVAGVGDGNTTYYAITLPGTAEFEVGIGTITDASPDTLARTTIISSSNSDSAVNFSAGTKTIFCTLPASKTVFLDASGDASIGGKITATGTSVFSDLDISGDVDIDGTLEADAVTVNGTALNTVIAGVTVTNATNATNATHVSVADNESTDEENLITFIEDTSATGNVGLESDGDFTYNPSTGTVSATVFKGNIDAVDGDFDGTLEADAITVAGTALNTVIAGVTVTNATNSAHVLVTDNESTDEDNLITFVEDATSSTGNVGLEMDGNLTYNPSTGRLTATQLAGTLQTAAQTNVTSLGTLTALTVDNIAINGTTIGHTDDTDLMTLADGIVTVAGEISVTTLDIGGTNVTATATELNYVDGVTSAIQTQIDTKASKGFAVAMAIAL